MNPWRLEDAEWDVLGQLLSAEPREGPGRRRLDNDRAAAEACLYRHFHSHSERYRSFGWNQLPDFLGVSPSTANRRFREWTDSGDWLRFWDALLLMRKSGRDLTTKADPIPDRAVTGFPAGDMIAELQRAYLFFNDRFFGGELPGAAITLERGRRGRRLGYFCARLWGDGERVLGHIAVHAHALDGTAEAALAVLLHEMVHLRNDAAGVRDCHPVTQYHSRNFRDVAVLCGLACPKRHPALGYAHTELDDRGRDAIKLLRPDIGVFRWVVGRRSQP